jgi:hypothetical protein
MNQDRYDTWIIDQLEPGQKISSQGGSFPTSNSKLKQVWECLKSARELGEDLTKETEQENNDRQDTYLKTYGI